MKMQFPSKQQRRKRWDSWGEKKELLLMQQCYLSRLIIDPGHSFKLMHHYLCRNARSGNKDY